MATSSDRKWLIDFLAANETTNEYNEKVEDWASPNTLVSRRARVVFGTAQEQRSAAKETGFQTASFICVRSADLDAITLKNRIGFDGSQWDLSEKAPLDNKDIRFTGTRIIQ